MADIEFDIAPRRKEPITFTLGKAPNEPASAKPHEYVFNPPKSASMMLPVLESDVSGAAAGLEMTKATFAWLDRGLSVEDQDRIEKRLMDEDDGLDLNHISDLAQELSERVAARPTS